MIENIEHLQAELDVEVLRDSADVIIFKDGEVQAGHSGADQDIAAGIAAEIEAREWGELGSTGNWSG